MRRSPTPEYVASHRALLDDAEAKVQKHRRFVEDAGDDVWKSAFSKSLLRTSEEALVTLRVKHMRIASQCRGVGWRSVAIDGARVPDV